MMARFSDDIKAIIEATGLSLKAVSEKVDIPYRTLQDWVYGKRTPNDLSQWAALEKIGELACKPITFYRAYSMGDLVDSGEYYLGLNLQAAIDEIEKDTNHLTALEKKHFVKNKCRYYIDGFTAEYIEEDEGKLDNLYCRVSDESNKYFNKSIIYQQSAEYQKDPENGELKLVFDEAWEKK